MARIETLKVWWPHKFGHQQIIINKDDFDPARHALEQLSSTDSDSENAEAIELLAEDDVQPVKRKAGRPKSK